MAARTIAEVGINRQLISASHSPYSMLASQRSSRGLKYQAHRYHRRFFTRRTVRSIPGSSNKQWIVTAGMICSALTTATLANGWTLGKIGSQHLLLHPFAELKAHASRSTDDCGLNTSQTPKKIVLASQSPRRRELLSALGFDFEVRSQNVDETVDPGFPAREVALHLARKKAAAAVPNLRPGEIIVAADTIVLLDNKVLGKPTDRADAISTLMKLSGRSHEVVTGVCVTDEHGKSEAFEDVALVTFRNLQKWEIEHYVDNYKPFDKAGSYGIQDWIGMAAVTQLNGSYFTVMGLPVHKLYQVLTHNFSVPMIITNIKKNDE